jgi:hypothetical protein
MGKPDKAVFISSRNSRRPVHGCAARPGALSLRPEVCFPSRIWFLAGDRDSSIPAVIPCFRKNFVAHPTCGAWLTELPDDRKCGLHSADPGIGGWHGEESFFEVLVVPFV